jgi:hypothetical protein
MEIEFMKAFLTGLLLASACSPALSPAKNQCVTQADCLSGYACVSGACKAPLAAPQTKGTAPTASPTPIMPPPTTSVPVLTMTTKLVDNATFAAVSREGSKLAYYTDFVANASAQSGTLSLLDVASGASTTLAADANGATFTNESDTLEFWTNSQPSIDAGSTLTFGALHAFTPLMGGPVQLGTGFAARNIGPWDRVYKLVFDVAQPSLAQPGTLRLYRLSECGDTSCPGQTIASNVLVTDLVASPNDEFAAYRVKVTNGTTVTYQTYLLAVGTASSTLIATATTQFAGPSLEFSPDSALLATTDGEGGFLVISTASHEAVPWAALPVGGSAVEFSFIDTLSLIVRVFSAQTDDGIYRVSSSASTQIAPSSQGYSLAGGRYVYVATNKSPYALTLLDLGMLAPTPITLTENGAGYPISNTTGDTALFIDQFDATEKSGVLTAVTAASGELTPIASHIFTNNYRFFASGADALYVANAGADTVGTLHVWSAGVDTVVANNVYAFAGIAFAEPTIYFDVTTTDATVSPPRTPGVYVTTLAP